MIICDALSRNRPVSSFGTEVVREEFDGLILFNTVTQKLRETKRVVEWSRYTLVQRESSSGGSERCFWTVDDEVWRGHYTTVHSQLEGTRTKFDYSLCTQLVGSHLQQISTVIKIG